MVRTAMITVQSYSKEQVERYVDALDHIMRVCRNTDVQTKRLLWIEKRADCAINGSEDWREYDYPKVRKAAKENVELRERIGKPCVLPGALLGQYQVTLVPLQTRKLDMLASLNNAGQANGILDRPHAAAAHADVQLDQRRKGHAGGFGPL